MRWTRRRFQATWRRREKEVSSRGASGLNFGAEVGEEGFELFALVGADEEAG
jgi:hypothetical protein